MIRTDNTMKWMIWTTLKSIIFFNLSIINHSLKKKHTTKLRIRSTDPNPQIGDLVVVYIRHTGNGRKRRLVTQSGTVLEIDSRDPKRVKTDTCPGKFRKVLEICTRHSTSMISNDTQSQSEHSIS